MTNETESPSVKKISPKRMIAAAIVVLLVLAVALGAFKSGNSSKKKEILVESQLEKIVNLSQLSTFSAVYNGIVDVKNPDNPEKSDYYVSYEAKVNAGIDFEKIRFNVDNQTIHVSLPKVGITKISVDIGSLDYIFINKKKNTPALAAEAYKICEEDVQTESTGEKAIFDLAKQNAENVVRALIAPFVDQLDADYTLQIDWEE